MESIYIDLDFSDTDLADTMSEIVPPEGVRISVADRPTIRAAAGADIVLTVSLHIKPSVELVAVALLIAKHLAKKLAERKKEKTRINDKELTPTPDQILALMREVIHWQKVRDAQWKESHQKKIADENKTP